MALPYDRIVGRWVLFLHLAAVLGFMLAHEVQVTVMWRVRAEPDPEKQEWLFQRSEACRKRRRAERRVSSPHAG
jgi:hypothetical protein